MIKVGTFSAILPGEHGIRQETYVLLKQKLELEMKRNMDL